MKCPQCKVELGNRIIGIEDRSVYDGVCWGKCPDCGKVWVREGMEDKVRKADLDKL